MNWQGLWPPQHMVQGLTTPKNHHNVREFFWFQINLDECSPNSARVNLAFKCGIDF